jgi:hypothetical protein
MAPRRYPWVWDYDIDADEFDAILSGRATRGRLDRQWAAVRVIEYGRYEDIVKLIGFGALVDHWAEWRPRVRTPAVRRGLDFLVEWLPRHHPELLGRA